MPLTTLIPVQSSEPARSAPIASLTTSGRAGSPIRSCSDPSSSVKSSGQSAPARLNTAAPTSDGATPARSSASSAAAAISSIASAGVGAL